MLWYLFEKKNLLLLPVLGGTDGRTWPVSWKLLDRIKQHLGKFCWLFWSARRDRGSVLGSTIKARPDPIEKDLSGPKARLTLVELISCQKGVHPKPGRMVSLV